MNVVYVTGNADKAKNFAVAMGMDIQHVSLELDEIQSTSVAQVVEHKAKLAYSFVNKPVIVEDTKLSFNALGALPGPLIKWFMEEIGEVGLCRLLDGYKNRSAVAGAAIAYFDGSNLEIFEKELSGRIADKPRGNDGFGWNVLFVPEGADQTFGEMSKKEFKTWYAKLKPFEELKRFLQSLDSSQT